jgi:hypothetical protein
MVRNYYLATKKKSINATTNDDDDDTSPPKLNGGKIDAVLGNNTDKKENDDAHLLGDNSCHTGG